MDVLEFDGLSDLSSAAAERVEGLAAAAVDARGLFVMALAGGSTPRETYSLLAERDAMPWDKAHYFFSDERCVPEDHEHSNLRMARETLFSKAPVPEANVHPVRVGGFAAGIDAASHEQSLRNFFSETGLDREGGCKLDLVLLGMGADGHVASLFPESLAVESKRQFFHAVEEGLGDPPVERVTMTFSLLNMARNVMVMIQGDKKRAVLDEILADPEAAAAKFPAARLNPRGSLTWLVAK